MKDLSKKKKKSLLYGAIKTEPVRSKAHSANAEGAVSKSGKASRQQEAAGAEGGENAFFVAFMQMKACLPVWNKLFKVSLEERTQACLKRRAASQPPGRHATAAAATAAESGGGRRHEEAEAELLNMVGGRNGPEPRLEGRVRFARAGEPARGPVQGH